jgi:hypothetical protein
MTTISVGPVSTFTTVFAAGISRPTLRKSLSTVRRFGCFVLGNIGHAEVLVAVSTIKDEHRDKSVMHLAAPS